MIYICEFVYFVNVKEVFKYVMVEFINDKERIQNSEEDGDIFFEIY